MQVNRRELMKGLGLLGVGSFFPTMTGCPTVDEVISGMEVALTAVQNVQAVTGLGAEVIGLFHLVDGALSTIITTYKAYDAAEASGKPGLANDIAATIKGVQANLSAILGKLFFIKNPNLVTAIQVGVAVVNTAITAVLNHVVATAPRGAQIEMKASPNLKVIAGVKKASDLKTTWNAAFAQFPEAQVK